MRAVATESPTASTWLAKPESTDCATWLLMTASAVSQQLDRAPGAGHGRGAEALGYDDGGLDLAGLDGCARTLAIRVAADVHDAGGLHAAERTLLESRGDLAAVEVDVPPAGVEVLVEAAEDHREQCRQHEGRDDADEQRGAIADLLLEVLEGDVEGGAHERCPSRAGLCR